jgi:hypothetical protein
MVRACTNQNGRNNPMFLSISKRMTFANFTMTVALVFVMSGGAYAAGKYLITSTKQIKPSVLLQLKGKNGTNGKSGQLGSVGPQGLGGPQGTVGPQGPAGENGSVGGTGPAGLSGPKGAAGPVGPAGPTGSPWTVDGTLPSGKTETGMWGFAAHDEGAVMVTMSFPIPLKQAPVSAILIKPGEEGKEEPVACPGTVEEPKAAAGDLCMYSDLLGTTTPMNFIDLRPSGVSGLFSLAEDNKGGFGTVDRGSWAVTAP